MADGQDNQPGGSRTSTPAFHGFASLGIPVTSDSDSDGTPHADTGSGPWVRHAQISRRRRRTASLQQQDARGCFLSKERRAHTEAEDSDATVAHWIGIN